MVQAYVHPSPCSNRHFLHSAQDSSPAFPPPASYMSILQEELYILLILFGILVYNTFNPLENCWSCWMHSGIRFLESSKLNDPECDVVLPLKWYRMQCQNWSKSFRARNMQSTLEGVLGPKLGPDFGDVLKVVLNFMSATWEKLLDNIVQVSTNWEEKSFTAFQKPNQHSWLLKSHFCCLLGWLLGFNLHSWIEQGTANNPNLANVN